MTWNTNNLYVTNQYLSNAEEKETLFINKYKVKKKNFLKIDK